MPAALVPELEHETMNGLATMMTNEAQLVDWVGNGLGWVHSAAKRPIGSPAGMDDDDDFDDDDPFEDDDDDDDDEDDDLDDDDFFDDDDDDDELDDFDE